MKSKKINLSNNGFTLVELMLVVAILGILSSVITPKIDQVLQKAYQATAKGNLGNLRSAMGLYYSEQEGVYPLAGYPPGDDHYTIDGLSLTGILVPKYTTNVQTPRLLDRAGSYNGLSVSYDDESKNFMEMNPPKDVFIVLGPANYTPLLDAPFAYDNTTGLIYYPNGNYTTTEEYFYNW